MDMPFEIRLGYEKRHNRLCQATSHAQDEDLVKAIDLALSNQPLCNLSSFPLMRNV